MSDGETTVPSDLTGHVLIAETELDDPNFFRTVVLIVHHNDEGAFGLVTNRKSDVAVADVIEETKSSPAGELVVQVGGPVQQNYVFVLHNGIPPRYRSDHAEEAGPGIVFEPSFQHVVGYMNSEDYTTVDEDERPRIHVFAGYSGWGAGQLEQEIAEGSWLVHPADPDVVFEPEPGAGWRAALRKKGGFYRIVAETGFKPSIN